MLCSLVTISLVPVRSSHLAVALPCIFSQLQLPRFLRSGKGQLLQLLSFCTWDARRLLDFYSMELMRSASFFTWSLGSWEWERFRTGLMSMLTIVVLLMRFRTCFMSHASFNSDCLIQNDFRQHVIDHCKNVDGTCEVLLMRFAIMATSSSQDIRSGTSKCIYHKSQQRQQLPIMKTNNVH